MDLKVNPKFNKGELLNLYAALGRKDELENYDCFRKSLKKSYVIAAYDQGRLAGLVNAISDNATTVYVKDLLISPNFDKSKVGKFLIEHLKSYYKAVPKIIISTSDTDTSELVLLKSVGFEEQDQKILEYS